MQGNLHSLGKLVPIKERPPGSTRERKTSRAKRITSGSSRIRRRPGDCGRRQIGELFEDIQKPIRVFYLGDHDPSGHDIERDIHQRAQQASGKQFRMDRLAIHSVDIQMFNLPPQRIKATDSRANGFQQRFGSTAPTVELDALPVAELRRRVDTAIERLIDLETWNRQLEVQEVEFKCIADFVERVKSLAQVSDRPQ